jgi:hypothetical protein
LPLIFSYLLFIFFRYRDTAKIVLAAQSWDYSRISHRQRHVTISEQLPFRM